MITSHSVCTRHSKPIPLVIELATFVIIVVHCGHCIIMYMVNWLRGFVLFWLCNTLNWTLIISRLVYANSPFGACSAIIDRCKLLLSTIYLYHEVFHLCLFCIYSSDYEMLIKINENI